MSFNALCQRLVESITVPKDGRVAELGSQTWSSKPGFKESAENFYRKLGWSVYQAFDISGEWNALQVDLNLPKQITTTEYDLVTNNGTGEHLFNQANVFQWMHDLCKPGGVMLHILPWVGWLNHGFYSFHPTLFRDLAKANGYSLEALYCGERNGRLDRIDGPHGGLHAPKPAREPWTNIERVVHSYGERADIFVCAVLKKTTDEAFRFPLQEKYVPEMKSFETRQPMIFDTPAAVIDDPYPYVIVENVLPQKFYDQLAANFPVWPVEETDPEIGNTLHQLPAHKALGAGTKPVADLTAEWRRFLLDHINVSFFHRLSDLFGNRLRPMMEKIGKPNVSFGVRNTGNFDISVDVQFAVNTPPKVKSRVRGPHVDSSDEIMAGLFYMPLPGDSSGGDLILYRWKEGAQRRLIGKAEIRDDLVEEFRRVPYRPNTAIFFLNGPDVVHGIDYREPTPHNRRYINFIVNASKSLFDPIPQEKTENWTGIRRVHQR